jgi:hypothetical protein
MPDTRRRWLIPSLLALGLPRIVDVHFVARSINNVNINMDFLNFRVDCAALRPYATIVCEPGLRA